MKKLLLVAVSIVAAAIAHAQSFTVGRIIYSPTSESTAEVVFNDAFIGDATIPNTVSNNGITYTITSIGEGAFNGCTNLTSVIIPNTVTSIGKNAFFYCTSLVSVSIPASVTSIGNGTFNGCSSLASISIPNSVTSLGEGAFSSCTSLTSVVIPNSLTTISDFLLNDCSNLSSITIPNTVTTIGKYALVNCVKLSNVFIPNSVVTIKEKVFAGCNMFTNIVIPNSVTTIELGAFSDCKNLQTVTLSNSLIGISEEMFFNCVSLSSISIPTSVKSIGNSAFAYTKLSSITIPSSITSIGAGAFSSCTSLTSITLPNSVEAIGGSAFLGCTALAAVTLPSSLMVIDESVFSNCTALSTITMPVLTRTIMANAFKYCSSLKSINFPNGLDSISNEAFTGCTSLDSLSIPGTVTFIGDYAFSFCDSLKAVSVNWRKPLAIKPGVFFNLNLPKVRLYIPKGTKDEYRFSSYDWRKFKLVGISFVYNGLNYNYTSDSTVEVATQPITFSGAADIPSIAKDAGSSYTVTSIGDNAFTGRVSLSSIKMPNTITRIGMSAFQACYGLSEIKIPEAVTTIDQNVFNDCINLTSISIPGAVSVLGEYAFTNCIGLTSIIVSWKNPLTISPEVFYLLNVSTITLKVPFGTDMTYDTADVWKDFNIQPIEKITLGGINYKFTSLTSVSIDKSPDATGIISIPKNLVFNGNTYKVTGISDGAFSGNTKITKILFTSNSINARTTEIETSNVTSIGKRAFEGCVGLTAVNIPSSVINIGDSAFAYCTSLSNVTVNWDTPLIVNESVFEGVQVSGIKLVVPTTKEPDYKSALVWKRFSIVTGIEDFIPQQISIYPNPAKDIVHINITDYNNSILLVLDNKGDLIQTLNLNSLTNKIDIRDLKSGLYVFKVNSNFNSFVQKVILE